MRFLLPLMTFPDKWLMWSHYRSLRNYRFCNAFTMTLLQSKLMCWTRIWEVGLKVKLSCLLEGFRTQMKIECFIKEIIIAITVFLVIILLLEFFSKILDHKKNSNNGSQWKPKSFGPHLFLLYGPKYTLESFVHWKKWIYD